MTTRVYVVEDVRKIEEPRLVRATYAHMAERHVIGKFVRARVANKEDLIDLISGGTTVEQCKDEEEVVVKSPEPPALK